MSGIAAVIADWLPQTITVQGSTDTDDDGDPVLAAQRTMAARVQADDKVIRVQDGTERKTSTVIYTQETIARGEFVWLPGTDTAKDDDRLEILEVTASPDKRNTTTLFKSRVP